MLDHERLDVYRRAIEFLVVAVKVIEAVPRGNGGLRDQLRRAAISIPLNIAEGCGRPGDADRARFYAMARGSAMECAAIMDVCAALGGVDAEPLANGKALLERIVAMLTKLCR